MPLIDDETSTAESAEASDSEQGRARAEAQPDRGRRKGASRTRTAAPRQVSLRTVAVAVVIVALVAALAMTTWVLVNTRDKLGGIETHDNGVRRAEQVATDYSVGAATMDFGKIGEWKARLTKGTNPELSNRLTQAATSMEQITAPLQWVSTATPISAKVRSVTGSKYVVDCFVSVITKNSQAPEGVQSTATYAVTIDSGSDWLITDVGGIGTMLGNR